MGRLKTEVEKHYPLHVAARDILHVHPHTLRRAIKRGELRSVPVSSAMVLISASAINEWLARKSRAIA